MLAAPNSPWAHVNGRVPILVQMTNKSASEHNTRPNKKVYTELCYYMENSIQVAMATTLDDERMS